MRVRLDNVVAQIFEHHYKLVPTQTSHGIVRPDGGLESVGHLLKEQVADVMASRVVQALEMVEIYEEDGPVMHGPTASHNREVQSVHEKPSIGQICQMVIEGKLFDLRFDALTLPNLNGQLIVENGGLFHQCVLPNRRKQ